MKRLNPILHFERLDLLGMALALWTISLRIYNVIPVLILFLWVMRKHLCWMLFLLTSCVIFLFYMTSSNQTVPDDIKGEAVITDVVEKDTYDKLILKYKHMRFIVYVGVDQYDVGDHVFVEGKVNVFEKQTVPKGFDSYHYYLSQNIDGKLSLIDMEILHQSFHFYTLREKVKDVIDEKELSHYVKLMLLGISLDDEKEKPYEELGISHLLSVSGLHLFVLIVIIKKIFFYINLETHLQDYAILVIYLIMAYLHQFDLGVLRLFIFAVLSFLNQRFEWRRTHLELLHITFFILLITNIQVIYFTSLLIVYIILLFLNLLEPLYREHHGFLRRMMMGSIVFVVLIPFQATVNLYTLLILPLFSIYLVAFWMTFSLIVLLLPFLNPVFIDLTTLIERLLSYLSQQQLTLIYGKSSVYLILLFFICFILFFLAKSYKKKILIVIVYLLCFMIPLIYNTSQTEIIFFDVGQGDATIIKSDGCIAVIDAFQGVYRYLTDHGISKIHYLFLTHSDTDHIKEAENLMQDMNVNHLILSKNDDEYPHYDHPKEFADAGDSYSCGDLKLEILAPFGDTDTSNNASLVIRTIINEYIFLFTGDIEEETETLLIETYGSYLKSNVLKVAHHGSNSSSTELFLHYVDPEVAIISAGRSNHYGFPHDEVIERLRKRNIIIYRTDLQGSILFRPFKKKSKWELHLPF